MFRKGKEKTHHIFGTLEGHRYILISKFIIVYYLENYLLSSKPNNGRNPLWHCD